MLFNLSLILFGFFIGIFWLRLEWIVRYWTHRNESKNVQDKIIRQTKGDKRFNTIRVILLISYLLILIQHLSK